ncbi:hypothetical protein K1T71_009967 [Dendrolimus kikuchii]|uniref:Uncharacterized protein n=1 Tax=Dendrolimus kikuchii TaxID=765133 RepID=A0ACC1CT86_9NEOP|nr:hypothetical protein K1T71_009967 [Dendrolimus kikuchii]
MENLSSICNEEGLLVGIGNPLLDISAIVDEELLKKYDMKPDDAIMAEEKHMPLYREIMDKADGVTVKYQITDEVPTGTCAVLVTGTHRSLCANLSAAQKFTPDHLAKEDCRKAIEAARFFYASGFFVAVSPESILQLATHAHANGHMFIMNLSALFVSQFYKEPLAKILPYVDVLFGNESEAEAFAKAFDIDGAGLKDIAVKMAALPKLDSAKPRVVVITQGCDPVILVEDGKVTLIPVTKLSREQIVDTNGAGDAFAGGFLSQMVLGQSYDTCVKCGIYSATHVIQHSGCTFRGVLHNKDIIIDLCVYALLHQLILKSYEILKL